MDNERLPHDAVALYSSVSSFMRRFRSDLVRTCSSDALQGLLDPIGELADELLHCGPLVEASRRALEAVPATLDLPTLVARISDLRTCTTKLWEREIGNGHPAAVRALHQALDRVVQLVVERDVNVAKLEGLLAASPVGIAFLDRDLRYLRINEALARMNGRPVAAHVGRTVRQVLPADAARFIEPMLRGVLETGVPVVNLEIDVYVVNYFPVRSHTGANIGIGGVVLDVGDRKRMENELRRAVRAREDLIAVVSHDLRNPLGTITLGSSLMQTDETLSERSRKHVDMIQRSARRMERLIDDLLDVATLQVGRVSLKLERVAAPTLVHDAVEAHQTLALDKQIELAQEAHLDGVDVECDPERVQRVFSNLVGNSLKFCRPGDTIRISGARAGDKVTFSVEDTGPGIDPGALPNLFDPYWSSPEHARRGVGLGLYISREIVAAHGGTISVDSEVGRGTRFDFTLPISR